jgi:hypothetical protein
MALKTVLVITVATYRMVFPGLSPIAPLPNVDRNAEPPATRSITMDLWSDATADAQSSARVTVPAGLKLEGPVKLTVDLKWKPPASTPASTGTGDDGVLTSSYWGCGETIRQGQPKVSVSGQTPPDPTPSAPALPTGSYAYWPGYDGKPLKPEASAVGTYTLDANYGGTASVTLGPEQDFLGTVHLVGVPKKFDLEKPLVVKWKPVPRALAYILNACGGNAGETVTWTSSADRLAAQGIEDRPFSASEITELINAKVLLPPNATTCTIPSGIFKGSDSVFLTVTAIGADKVETRGNVETRVLVRSTVSVPIAGTTYKPMPDPEGEKR